MKKKNLTTIWIALKQAGFNNREYAEHYWVKPGYIVFEFQYWPCGCLGSDLFCRMQAWTGRNEMLLSEVDFYLTDISVSELKPDWIEARMQELAKKAYDILAVKAKAAAEIAMMGA